MRRITVANSFAALIFFVSIATAQQHGRSGAGSQAKPWASSSRASAFVLGLFVYYIFAIIPVLGWLVVALVMLFGVGAELSARKQFYMTARSQELI